MFKRKLAGAESVLSTRSKIKKALRGEEDSLQKLITDRVAAEKAVIENETAEAIGERNNLAGARGRLDSIMGAIHKQAAKLTGLRIRLAEQASDLTAEYGRAKDALPEHISEVKAAFVQEWNRAVEAFSAVLSKRAEIERLTGEKLSDLAEPCGSACELSDEISGHWRIMERLKNALDEIAGWRVSASTQRFDTTGVYVLTRQYDHLETGAVVMEPSLPPGILARLIEIGYAVPLREVEWEKSVWPAQTAVNSIEDGQRRERAQRQAKAEPPYPYDLEKAREADAQRQRMTGDPEVVARI